MSQCLPMLPSQFLTKGPTLTVCGYIELALLDFSLAVSLFG